MKSDDDDMASLWRDVKAASQAKRSSNRETSAQRLRDEGIDFVSHNFGSHITIGEEWDFWAGTGLFRHRKLPIRGRGIRGLIQHIKQLKKG